MPPSRPSSATSWLQAHYIYILGGFEKNTRHVSWNRLGVMRTTLSTKQHLYVASRRRGHFSSGYCQQQYEVRLIASIHIDRRQVQHLLIIKVRPRQRR